MPPRTYERAAPGVIEDVVAGGAVFAGSPRAFFARIASSEQPFLSHSEEFLWWSARLAGDATFNVRVVLRLRGPLRLSALEASIVEIARRHETLRTVFPMESGVIRRRLLPPDAARPVFTDLEPSDPATREGDAWRLVLEESNRPFNLARGPLFRSRILRVEPDSHLLQFTIHHLVIDGRSVDILLRELGALYTAYSGNRESPLPELTVQYAAHAAERKRLLAGPRLERTLAYWRGRLAGSPSLLALPTDAIRRTARHYPGHTLTFGLDAERTAAIQALARRYGTTTFVLLLSVLKLLLYRLSGNPSIAVETPFGNRRSLKAEGLIGLLVDLVPLRTDLSGNPTFPELLAGVRQTTLGAFDHAGISIHQLVGAVDVNVDQSHSAICQVMFNLINRQQRAVHLASLQAEQLPLPDSPHSKFDLMLTAHLTDALGFQLLYRRDLFSEARMHVMVDQFTGLLDQALAASDRRIEQYSLVTRRGIEAAAPLQPGDGISATTRGTDIASRVRSHAAERSRIALLDGREEASYGELDTRGDEVAAALAAGGVRSGDAVPVHHGSPLAVVAGLLGAIRAGASTVILDAEGAPATWDVQTLSRCGGWMAEAFSLAPGSRVGVLPGTGAGVLIQAAFAALSAGATLHVPPPGESSGNVETWMNQPLAVAFGEPAAWRRLRKNGSRLPSLRCAVFVGGVLVREDVLRVRALSPDAACCYVSAFDGLPGPSCWRHLPPGDRDLRTIVPLGCGLPGVDVLVLTREGEPAGVGELGEIHVRDGRQGELAWPARDQVAATGLLGRVLPDESIDRVGGPSDWGSVDGYTIRFDEVASALMRHPDILDARVSVETNGSRAELVARVVCDDERAWPGDALAEFLSDHVPGYMTPCRITRVSSRRELDHKHTRAVLHDVRVI